MRQIRQADAEPLFRLIDANREHLVKYLSWVETTKDQSDTEKFIKSAVENFEQGIGQLFCIVYQKEIVGTIGLIVREYKSIPTHMIGYWLDQGKQGKGIMTSCTKLLCQNAFEKLDCESILIRCHDTNDKSANVALRSGFTYVGTFDDVCYEKACKTKHFVLKNPRQSK